MIRGRAQFTHILWNTITNRAQFTRTKKKKRNKIVIRVWFMNVLRELYILRVIEITSTVRTVVMPPFHLEYY